MLRFEYDVLDVYTGIVSHKVVFAESKRNALAKAKAGNIGRRIVRLWQSGKF